MSGRRKDGIGRKEAKLEGLRETNKQLGGGGESENREGGCREYVDRVN